jgi:hypothetical protein
MNKHPNLRATFGAALGFEAKGMLYARDTTGAAVDNGINPPGKPHEQVTSGVEVYTAPVFLFDGGIMIGPPTGPRFYVGGLMILELVGGPAVTTGAPLHGFGSAQIGRLPMQMANGTQIFLGPVIGLRFGE